MERRIHPAGLHCCTLFQENSAAAQENGKESSAGRNILFQSALLFLLQKEVCGGRKEDEWND